MNIEEMKETGVYDYFDALNKWINYFVNRNYPLSKDDIRALIEGNTTDNIINRNRVLDILKNELNDQLIKKQEMNAQMIEKMEEGIYTPYSIENLNNDIEEMQQEMLEKLHNELHPQEQQNFAQTGEQMLEDVINKGQEIDIRVGEINEANIEINQEEKNYLQEQQQILQNVDSDIGMDIEIGE